MNIPFFKYEGAGNDFVLVDNRRVTYLTRNDQAHIARLCDRHFGIGADGLMLLQERAGYDFEMIYFNADGRESTMCGNGGRCITAFAHRLGITGNTCRFLAVDGPHEARMTRPDWVELGMSDVREVIRGNDYFTLNTGSPHYVTFVDSLDETDVFRKGRAIRQAPPYAAEGINVNFVEAGNHGIRIGTYERGVEDETLACGTGVTAAAIAFYLLRNGQVPAEIPVTAKGGQLSVRFERANDGSFVHIWLCGPASFVFEGNIVV